MNPLLPVKTSKPTSMGSGDWLELECIKYSDNNNIERNWERCIRKKSSTSLVDAVDIQAILLNPNPELLLVVQYRPAVEHYCIEFPSGLIDEGEDPIIAAQRELKEETGYSVTQQDIELVKTPLSYEPGLTNSCCYVAKVIIDTSVSGPPVPELEQDEWSLQSISLPLDGLIGHLTNLEKQHNGMLVIDSRVQAFAAGIDFAKKFAI